MKSLVSLKLSKNVASNKAVISLVLIYLSSYIFSQASSGTLIFSGIFSVTVLLKIYELLTLDAKSNDKSFSKVLKSKPSVVPLHFSITSNKASISVSNKTFLYK